MISLLVPYRPGDRWRDTLWAWLREAWQRELPEAEILTGDDGLMPFSRAAAVNAAAAKASGDVFVILDADTWYDPTGLKAAAWKIEKGQAWVPKARKWFLDEDATTELIGQPFEGFERHRLRKTKSDRYVIPAPTVVSRRAWDTVNGFDERFRGWGCEDNAFIVALSTLAPADRRGVGEAFHLWHPNRMIDGQQVWDGQDTPRPGLAHLARYHTAARKRGAMAALVTGNREVDRAAGFARIWATNAWQGSDTKAGPGSSAVATTELAATLASLLASADSVLDVGCGDCFWQPELPGYVGIDIVPEAIERAQARHPGRRFFVADAVTDPLPPADAVLCRDTMIHLSLDDGLALLENVRKTGARTLLATTFTDGRNTGAVEGYYRPDLSAAPFSLGPPRTVIPDGLHPGYVVPEKTLGVWDLA